MGGWVMKIRVKPTPAADVKLPAPEGVFFPQHSLLWQDPSVQVDSMGLRGGWDRMRGGLPGVMLEATGPGTISFSADRAGELVAIPVPAGGAVAVRAHHMVPATEGMGFDWAATGIWLMTPGNP